MIVAPPRSRHEARRVATLQSLGVLDTLPEQFSASVVAAAAAIVNVPIAAISLVDENRNWFKGACGLDAAEVPRDLAFCAHTILSNVPFVVEDLAADPLFIDHPLVVGPPHARFYAGFPLIVHGQSVGALCVIDDRSRRLATTQIERLLKLARGLAAWLETYREDER